MGRQCRRGPLRSPFIFAPCFTATPSRYFFLHKACETHASGKSVLALRACLAHNLQSPKKREKMTPVLQATLYSVSLSNSIRFPYTRNILTRLRPSTCRTKLCKTVVEETLDKDYRVSMLNERSEHKAYGFWFLFEKF